MAKALKAKNNTASVIIMDFIFIPRCKSKAVANGGILSRMKVMRDLDISYSGASLPRVGPD
jgi:hypothetical protein